MKPSYLLPAIAAPLAAAATTPPPIDIAALDANPALNALFTDLGDALNKPASEIKKHTIDTLTSPDMVRLLQQLKDTPNAGAELETDKLFDAALMAALSVGKKEGKPKTDEEFDAAVLAAFGGKTEDGYDEKGEAKAKGKGKRGVPEECVKSCVDIKTQSCELLKGTHLSEASCTKERVELDCKDSCKV